MTRNVTAHDKFPKSSSDSPEAKSAQRDELKECFVSESGEQLNRMSRIPVSSISHGFRLTGDVLDGKIMAAVACTPHRALNSCNMSDGGTHGKLPV